MTVEKNKGNIFTIENVSVDPRPISRHGRTMELQMQV